MSHVQRQLYKNFAFGMHTPPTTRMNQNSVNVKLLLIGNSGVGKTAILYRFVDDVYNPTFISTIGIDFKIKSMNVDGKEVKLQIWDTAGQERFKQTLTPSYYRNADGVLLVFDLTNLESLDNISTWVKNIEENATPDIEKLFVANKCDLAVQRVVTTERVNQQAQKNNTYCLETSAKTGHNIHELFYQMVTRILAKRPAAIAEAEIRKNADVIKIGKKHDKLKGWKKRCYF